MNEKAMMSIAAAAAVAAKAMPESPRSQSGS